MSTDPSPAPRFPRCRRLLYSVFGKIRYEAPPWLKALLRHKWILAGSLVILCAMASGVRKYLEWSEAHRTRLDGEVPVHDVQAKLLEPGLPQFDQKKGKLSFQPLVLQFSRGAATVRHVGHGADMDISLRPAAPGTWKWAATDKLLFTPEKDWQPGTKYRLKLGALPAPEARLINSELSWKTPAFHVTEKSIRFSADVKEEGRHRITGRLVFSHPVSLDELAGNSSLEWMEQSPEEAFGADPAPPLEWSAGKSPMEFFFRSAPVRAGEKRDVAVLRLHDRLSSLSGGRLPADEEVLRLRVPDKYNILHLAAASAEIATQPDTGTPRRILSLEMTSLVRPADVQSLPELREIPAALRTKNAQEQWDKGKPLKLEPAWDAEDARRPTSSLAYTYESDSEQNPALMVKVPKGFPGLGGIEQREDEYRTIDQADYPSKITVAGRGSILQFSGERKLRVTTRNVGRLLVTVSRTSERHLPWLLAKNWKSFSVPDSGNEADLDMRPFSDITHSVRRVFDLTASRPSEDVKTALDLNDFLKEMDGGAGDRGVFVLKLESIDKLDDLEPGLVRDGQDQKNLERIAAPKEGDVVDLRRTEDYNGRLYMYHQGGWKRIRTGHSHSRLLMLTDIGLIVKKTYDEGRDVWALSLKDGSPVSDAEYSLIGRNGDTLSAAAADAAGHVRFDPDPLAWGEREPVCIVARRGRDFAFLPLTRIRKTNYGHTDVWGLETRDMSSAAAFVFTERGVYRPGETVHAAILVKRNDWGQNLDGMPLTINLQNPRFKMVEKEAGRVGEGGLSSIDFKIPAEAVPGEYRVHVGIPGDRPRHLGSASFIVRDFEPDRIKISGQFIGEGTGWLSPENASYAVQVQNLYGTPARSCSVKLGLQLDMGAASLPGWNGWAFHADSAKELEEYSGSLSFDAGELSTDGDGRAAFPLHLEKYEGSTYTLTAVAEAFEAGGGRSVRTKSTRLISPWPYLLAVKAGGNTDWIPRGAPFEVQWAAVGSDLRPQAVEGLFWELEQKKERVVLSKDGGGNFQYEAVTRWEKVSDRKTPLPLRAGANPFSLPTDKAGSFRLVVSDGEGHVKSRLSYTVTGEGGDPAAVERDSEIRLSTQKEVYKPGDVVEIAVDAPFAGSGLATLEREKVWAAAPFRTETPKAVVSLRIPENAEGTLYAAVCYLRAPDSPDVYRNPFARAAAAIEVRRPERSNAISLEVPEKAESGRGLAVTYRTAQPCRLILYGVDEGILQFTGYRLPDPKKRLMAKRRLDVDTTQWLSLVLPEYHSLIRDSLFGGGNDALSEAEAGGTPINPFARVHERSVVFWSGPIEADEQPRTLVWPLPDYFSGTLRVMAVAVNDRSLGNAEAKVLVQAPIILTPTAPAVLSPGDETTVNLNVVNMLGTSGAEDIEVTAEASPNGPSVEPARQTVSLVREADANLQWRVTAPARPGACTVTFTARAAGREIRRSAAISVRPASPRETRVTSGSARKSPQEIPIRRDMLAEGRVRRITASASPSALLGGLSAYMESYPHECTEQMASRAIVAAVLERLQGKDDPSLARRAETVCREADAILENRQSLDGDFGAWSPRCPSPELNLHVAGYFLLLGEKYSPRAIRLKKALQRFVRENGLDLSQASMTAEAVYLLARMNVSESALLTALRDALEQDKGNNWRQTATGMYIAAAGKLMKMGKEADALALSCLEAGKKAQASATARSPYAGEADIDALKRLTLLFEHFPELSGNQNPGDLQPILAPLKRDLFNTWDAAYVALAINAYEKMAGNSATFTAETLSSGGWRTLRKGVRTLSEPLPDDAEAVRIKVSSPRADQTTFFQLLEAGYDARPETGERRDGLEISREYLDDAGNPVTSIPLGKAFTVRIRVRNLTGEPLRDIAVTDLLPGSCEAALGTLKPGMATVAEVDFVSVSEDRNMFYLDLPDGGMREFSYKLKAVNPGIYTVPPIMAEHMYKRYLKGISGAGAITVEP